MDTLYLVMPAYNEESNIENVVKSWYPIVETKNEKSRLVVADSGSTDNTHEILLQLCKENSKLVVLNNTGKLHGPKVIALYKYAIENGADYIFQTDSDGQTAPEEFKDFWDIRGKYDAVIGSRPVRGDGLARKYVEKVVCLLVRIYFKTKVPDANAPFRLMRTTLVGKYLSRLPDDYALPNIVLTALFAHYNEKIIFKEISFKPRQGGENSIDIKKIIRIGIKSLGEFAEYSKKL